MLELLAESLLLQLMLEKLNITHCRAHELVVPELLLHCGGNRWC
jgi:hypothetical protein